MSFDENTNTFSHLAADVFETTTSFKGIVDDNPQEFSRFNFIKFTFID